MKLSCRSPVPSAAGLENADVIQQTLIHINELDAEQPIEAEVVTSIDVPECH